MKRLKSFWRKQKNKFKRTARKIFSLFDTHFSKAVVVGVIAANIWFTREILRIYELTGTEPGALIAAWFSFTTVELWGLSKITRDKKKYNALESVEKMDCGAEDPEDDMTGE